MNSEMKLVERAERPMSMNPKKFGLWLFMISVTMMFASLTSAYIVRKGDGNWRLFELPDLFWITSGIIILSSISMIIASRSAKQNNLSALKVSLLSTFLLGVAFLIGQFYSWSSLINNNVYFTGGNASESFIYVLTGVHWVHLVSGLIFLTIIMVKSFRFEIHSKNLNQLQMCATYWHFLGGLWIYLFLFLMFNHQ